MKIIFAQGNPGLTYQGTRHNVGFSLIDFYADKYDTSFQERAKFRAAIAELTINNEKILLVKPTTFYNDSGTAARTIVDFYKIDITDVLVLHDELALPFGTIRSRQKGRDAGNNGIKSLNAHLGENYARLRIGIWNDHAEIASAFDFVLGRFSLQEINFLKDRIFPKATEVIDGFIADTIAHSSHRIALDM